MARSVGQCRHGVENYCTSMRPLADREDLPTSVSTSKGAVLAVRFSLSLIAPKYQVGAFRQRRRVKRPSLRRRFDLFSPFNATLHVPRLALATKAHAERAGARAVHHASVRWTTRRPSQWQRRSLLPLRPIAISRRHSGGRQSFDPLR